GILFVVHLMCFATATQSIASSPTRTTIETFGNKWNRSRASRLECAVSTLYFAVSSTSFRTDNAWLGSGSATSIVGLGILEDFDAQRRSLAAARCFLVVQAAGELSRYATRFRFYPNRTPRSSHFSSRRAV